MNQEKDRVSPESLDGAGSALMSAAALSEAETDDIAAAPFLFSRIKARIDEEQQRQESRNVWAGFWMISKRAIPAMMIIAALSFGLSAYMTGNKTQPVAFSVDAYLRANESGMDNMLFAERRPLTREEVLNSIIARDEREASR